LWERDERQGDRTRAGRQRQDRHQGPHNRAASLKSLGSGPYSSEFSEPSIRHVSAGCGLGGPHPDEAYREVSGEQCDSGRRALGDPLSGEPAGRGSLRPPVRLKPIGASGCQRRPRSPASLCALPDYAYTGHDDIVSASRYDQQHHCRRSRDSLRREGSVPVWRR
jgi:hypothetical protein